MSDPAATSQPSVTITASVPTTTTSAAPTTTTTAGQPATTTTAPAVASTTSAVAATSSAVNQQNSSNSGNASAGNANNIAVSQANGTGLTASVTDGTSGTFAASPSNGDSSSSTGGFWDSTTVIIAVCVGVGLFLFLGIIVVVRAYRSSRKKRDARMAQLRSPGGHHSSASRPGAGGVSASAGLYAIPAADLNAAIRAEKEAMEQEAVADAATAAAIGLLSGSSIATARVRGPAPPPPTSMGAYQPYIQQQQQAMPSYYGAYHPHHDPAGYTAVQPDPRYTGAQYGVPVQQQPLLGSGGASMYHQHQHQRIPSNGSGGYIQPQMTGGSVDGVYFAQGHPPAGYEGGYASAPASTSGNVGDVRQRQPGAPGIPQSSSTYSLQGQQ